jgi:hypothetical protein
VGWTVALGWILVPVGEERAVRLMRKVY